MSRVSRLFQSYGQFISLPWTVGAAAPQRVIFCVYHEHDELRLRARIDEFELATKQAGHDWALFDLTDTFATWLVSRRYAQKYFEQPALLPTLLPKYRDYLVQGFTEFLAQQPNSPSSVVAVKGVGSLFGFAKVKDIVDAFAPLVPGRLLVFFPGSHENNNYRLLDGYDGWNYLAIPITADKES